MVLNGYFLVVESIVQIEQIVQSHEMNWVYQALLIQECLEFKVFVISKSFHVKLNLIEIPLSIVESVNIFIEVQVWEMVLQEKSGILEWLIVNDRQDVVLGQCRINDGVPYGFVFAFCEKHVIDQIVKQWEIEGISTVFGDDL